MSSCAMIGLTCILQGLHVDQKMSWRGAIRRKTADRIEDDHRLKSLHYVCTRLVWPANGAGRLGQLIRCCNFSDVTDVLAASMDMKD